MRQRIDIGEVEAQTKIRAKYLRAIENEEWDLLPGPVYAKSFLRTYGDYLGLDSRTLVDEFRRRYERPAEQDIRPVSSRPLRDRDRRPPRRVPSWVSILAVAAVVLVVLGIVGSLGTGSKSPGTTNPPAVGGPKAHHNPPPSAARSTVRSRPTTATLHMVATGPLYVCLVRGNGTRLIFEQTYNPGQTIPTETGSRLLLTLGNNNVRMRVNGEARPVPASATPIRYLITPTTVRPIPYTQTPTCP